MVYKKRIIASGECDTLDEAQGLIQVNSDRTCELSEALKTVIGRTLRIGDEVTISEDGQLYTGTVAKLLKDDEFEVDFPDGEDGCYGPDDLV